MPSHQEAVRAAIAAGADGIVSTSPDPGSLIEVVAEARAAGIPIINMNTPDPTGGFPCLCGHATSWTSGTRWAQYLVDNGLVEEGDFVWMPVEVPGATYGVQEEEGIATVFEPLGITWEVTDATLDQAEVITRMSDYLTANGAKVDAIIGLGDLVTGSIQRVFDQVGIAPGDIPVVGWGNSVDTSAGDPRRLRQRRHVAGPAGDELCGAVDGEHGRQRHPAGVRRDRRRALRRGDGRDLRRHHVGPIGSRGATRPRRTRRGRPLPVPNSGEFMESQSLLRRLVAKPEFGPFVLLIVLLGVAVRLAQPATAAAATAGSSIGSR